ncbi:hypothetical protein RND81_06G195000 [Saponaria officinalis]|uniref:TRF2/HOY1 PH-like domain-containing protein n=1 Tax=Saponaria officinalis TaxID=3572 RepID=A0AAW1KBR6_SAPOF
MVHRMDSMEDSPAPVKSCRKKVMMKPEFELENRACFSKRRKFGFSTQVEGAEKTEYNPLEDPSPLGLKLKKSPSLLELIQMRLSQEKTPSLAKTLARKEKCIAIDKLKASNFPASLLKIGTWEYTSRYEGDLVAKCYFAKHKLVWEVLDGGLKNKIEIQWSDIMAIKAKYPDNEPETLDVVLSRQPLFFREINPQPRKHTLWQATTDFTSGQASVHRQHFLQFPQGTLQKHFEKLMQCDPRLRYLSQQPEIVLDSPYFQPMVSVFGDSTDGDRGFSLKADGIFSFSGFTDSGLSSSEIDNQDRFISSTRHKSQGHNRSITETYAMEVDVSSKMNETRGLNLLNQIKLPGLHPSMSVGDLVNHIGDCISEQIKSDNPNLAINEFQKTSILEEISQYLLTDSQTIPVSDEKSIMSRVNSLCCLLQKDPSGVENLLPQDNKHITTITIKEGTTTHQKINPGKVVNQMTENHHHGHTPGMVRKDSFGELLLHLPRITSLPQFLISVPEDSSEE